MSSTVGSRAARALLYNLLALALVLVSGGVALAYGIDALGRQGYTVIRLDDETPAVKRTIAGRDLSIPLSWFRYGEQAQEGFASQVDLAVDVPIGKGGALSRVDITLLPRSRARPSSSLLDGVYLHQFDATDVTGAPGLVGKPLIASAGFDDETVWYDPLSSDPFVAKCMDPVRGRKDGQCLRTVMLKSGIAVVYSFTSDALASWRSFDRNLTPWLQRIGAL